MKPIFFKSHSSLPKDTYLMDVFSRSLKELFFVGNPKFKEGTPESEKPLHDFLSTCKIKGIWIYMPWKKIAVYTVPEEVYFKLRTARNRDVITKDEQRNFRNSSIGIVGLSVGSVLLSSIVSNGGPKNIRLADFDEIEITNLNRMKATILDVGKNKADVAAFNVWELDPFASLQIWREGVSKNNLEKFISHPKKLDLFVDTMDSLDLKILSRFICKKYRIPVVMITENADNSIIDVERYDQDRDLKIFNGRLGNFNIKDFESLTYREWLKLAARIVGADFLAPSMQRSILKLGKSIASVPQLSTSVSIGGASATAMIRRIINKKPLLSGRYLVNLDEKIIPGYNEKKAIINRKKMSLEFVKKMTG